MTLSSRHRAVAALAAIGVAGIATWFATRPAAEVTAPPAKAPVAVLPDVVPPPPVVPAAPAAAVEQKAAPAAPLFPALRGKGSVKFPDGSIHAALNGVTDDLEADWPGGYPYAPIVEKLHHNGADWYRHADGTFTTTLVRTETVSGRTVQGAFCFTPSVSKSENKLRQ